MAKPARPASGTHIRYIRDGDVWVNETAPGLFLVSWYPHRHDHPDYPGVSFDSESRSVPTDGGIDGVLEWATEEFERRDPRDLLDVSLEAEAEPSEVADVERALDEAGVPAVVTASIERKSALPDGLPWILMLQAPLAAFLTAMAGAAGQDAWKALKALVHRLYEARKNRSNGSIQLETEEATIILTLDLPDEAYKQVVAGLPPGYYVWDAEAESWRDY